MRQSIVSSSHIHAFAGIAAALLLAGCGGGGTDTISASTSGGVQASTDTTNAIAGVATASDGMAGTDHTAADSAQTDTSTDAPPAIDQQEIPTVTIAGFAANTRVSDSAAAQAVSSTVTGPGWVSPALVAANAPQTSYTPSYSGRAWHIDQSRGQDTNPGTAAAPWKTLAPTAKLTMGSGDALLMKCGEVLRGTLAMTSVNAPAGNVLIGGYGDCSGDRRPVIRASDWVSPTGWTKVGAGTQLIYAKTTTQKVSRLFIDGKPLIKARFPNYRQVGAEFALATAAPSNTSNSFMLSAADRAKIGSSDMVGATVYVRATQWQSLKARVNAYDAVSGRVTLDTAMPLAIKSGTGFILEGKRWMLDSAGEWFHDEPGKQLLVWSPTGVSPAQIAGMEASWRPFGVNLRWIKNLRLERVVVEQQDVDGLELTETPNATLTDVKARHVQEIGISALTAPGVVIQNSTVESAGNYGIVAREADNSRVLRNHVFDTGGWARAGATDAAIAVFGAGAVVESNLVERSASFGIRFANRAGTVVRSNTVMSFCMRLTDCAGIYTYTGGAIGNMPTKYVPASLVEGNIVVGAKSNQEGCGYHCSNMAAGIYWDELTAGATLSGNIISDTEVGITALNGSFNRFVGNTVRGSKYAAFRGTQTRTEPGVMRGNQITNNSFYAYRGMSLTDASIPKDMEPVNAQFWYHHTDPALLFSGIDPNVVSGNENLTVLAAGEVNWTLSTPTQKQILKESSWRQYAPTDRQTNRVTYKPLDFTTEASLIKNGRFDPTLPNAWYAYLNPVSSNGSFSMASFSDCGKTCGRLVAGTTADYLVSNAFAVTNTPGGNLYALSFTATGGALGGQRMAYVRRAISPWDNFGLSVAPQALRPGEISKVEAFFRANASSDAAVLDLRSSIGGETFFTDVALARVQSITFPDMQRLSTHVINPTHQPLTFPCTAFGLTSCELTDDTGAAVSFPMVVAARSTRTVFVRDARWMR